MSGLSSSQRRALEATGCEVRADDLTRTLYATDASIYRVQPLAVAFPRSAVEASAVIRTAADMHLPIIPRGAGSGLTGGALGEGVVVDLARHNRAVDGFDEDRNTVRVGAGVVLDQLNRALRPRGRWFGPDVATSSRATLGGMIGNNSSGAYAPVYGTTVDHVEALEVVLGDGRIAWVGSGRDELSEMGRAADDIVAERSDEITSRLHDQLVKRWSGYGLDKALRRPGDLTRLICGSEGTLAAVTSAIVRTVPRPTRRGLGVVFFDSIGEAMAAAVELLDLEPAAVEHVDRILLDQTRGQPSFARARSLLDLDHRPCESILLVEFFDGVEDRLELLRNRAVGSRRLMLSDPADQELVWGVRRAGLSLLTGCKGPSKPATCIEDVCVRPDQLPDYVAAVQEILGGRGLAASFYGHAASGELHIRPALDLHSAADIATLRAISDEVSELCRRFGGSLAAEHGVGIPRTEYLEYHLGEELMTATRELKELFDPSGVMNPGKIVDTGRFRIDRDLRLGEGSQIDLPFDQQFGWVHKDGSFVGNLEQCNGCAGCLKETPTMCPTYSVTGDELLSTRGRSNVISAVLDGRLGEGDLGTPGLDQALTSCLACKACRTECPSNVDMAALKAELAHATHAESGVPLGDRLIASADWVGRAGSRIPAIANAALTMTSVRQGMRLLFGIDAQRTLPSYAHERFDHWFAAHPGAGTSRRGQVVLWDDTWVRYHEPHIGQAAVRVLEAAGFEVVLPTGRECCGRPAVSRGLLDKARRLAAHNVALLLELEPAAPVVFLEPSCHSMFVDEYRQFEIPGADRLADRCVLFEELMVEVLREDSGALALSNGGPSVAIHGHCHAKALGDADLLPELAEFIPGVRARLLETGCCGMAGAFGMLEKTVELSTAVARPLVEMVNALPAGTRVVASGTSCRHQIAELTDVEPMHMAELLSEHLSSDP